MDGEDRDAFGVALREASPSGLSVSKVVLEMIQMPPFSRMLWIDHLRMFVILLVVNMHACVTNSHVGGWYVTSANEPTLAQKGTIRWGLALGFGVDGSLLTGGAQPFRFLVVIPASAFAIDRWLDEPRRGWSSTPPPATIDASHG